MMRGYEKSDSVIVAVKPTNKAEQPAAEQSAKGQPQRSRWSEGRGPRGMQNSKAPAGHRAGAACHRRWDAYGKLQRKGRRRGSPRSSTTSASTCLNRRSTSSKRTLRRARIS